MKYKLQLWDENEFGNGPIKEWVVGLDREAEINLINKSDRNRLAGQIWGACAKEDVLESERAHERSLGDAWDGGFADNH